MMFSKEMREHAATRAPTSIDIGDVGDVGDIGAPCGYARVRGNFTRGRRDAARQHQA
ncbi:hypothetical protein [Sorangium sp. So ce341]|uniref:hypothetical protein n=1 Tax=Sorangium sp. So ce341 TaxID=3133302 RepID=UPI003F60B401